MPVESARKRLPVIHIGMPKTATKTLQWRVFALHSEIFYLGRFDGEPFGDTYRAFEACRDSRVLAIMEKIAYRGMRSADTAACRTALISYLAEKNPEGRLPVWSWESYCTDSPESRKLRAANLKQLLGEAKILVSIRNPVQLLESAFLQQLKRDNIGSGFRPGRPAFFCDINDWYRQDRHKDISNHLDYANTIRWYAEAFGPANVCMLPFELLQQNARAFFSRVAGFMDIDPEETLKLVTGQADNSRWTEIQIERLAEIRRSPRLSRKFRGASRRQRKAMLDLAPDNTPRTAAARARAVFEAELVMQIAERTRAGNAWLEAQFHQGLPGWGYST